MQHYAGQEGPHRIARIGASIAATLALAIGCGDGADTTKDPASGAMAGGASGAMAGGSAGGDDSGSDAAGNGDAAADTSPADLIARGERVYNVNCIACHHRDPTQDGGLGPPVAGSSRELIEARVIRGEYPPGYTPKADTRLMIPLPHLEPEIDALAAFLASRAE